MGVNYGCMEGWRVLRQMASERVLHVLRCNPREMTLAVPRSNFLTHALLFSRFQAPVSLYKQQRSS